ncbi:MAG: hypothetical protein ACRENE_32380 [Polyangiaceae bacterium]
MPRRRSWYAGLVVIPRTALRTASTLRDQGLGRFVPFVLVLLLGAAVLWTINAIAPLAPFIYSLF